MSVYYFVDRQIDLLKTNKHKIMIPQIPEINPVQLLYNPYNPITRYELAEILGVSDCTVKSWIERKRNPAKPVQKLAALILEQWQKAK